MESPLTIITGASRGIGRAATQELLNRGRRVVGIARSAAAVEHHQTRVSQEQSAAADGERAGNGVE